MCGVNIAYLAPAYPCYDSSLPHTALLCQVVTQQHGYHRGSRQWRTGQALHSPFTEPLCDCVWIPQIYDVDIQRSPDAQVFVLQVLPDHVASAPSIAFDKGGGEENQEDVVVVQVPCDGSPHSGVCSYVCSQWRSERYNKEDEERLASMSSALRQRRRAMKEAWDLKERDRKRRWAEEKAARFELRGFASDNDEDMEDVCACGVVVLGACANMVTIAGRRGARGVVGYKDRNPFSLNSDLRVHLRRLRSVCVLRHGYRDAFV